MVTKCPFHSIRLLLLSILCSESSGWDQISTFAIGGIFPRINESGVSLLTRMLNRQNDTETAKARMWKFVDENWNLTDDSEIETFHTYNDTRFPDTFLIAPKRGNEAYYVCKNTSSVSTAENLSIAFRECAKLRGGAFLEHRRTLKKYVNQVVNGSETSGLFSRKDGFWLKYQFWDADESCGSDFVCTRLKFADKWLERAPASRKISLIYYELNFDAETRRKLYWSWRYINFDNVW